MKTNEEILEYLETPEGRKKANDLAREYINKINDEDKKGKILFLILITLIGLFLLCKIKIHFLMMIGVILL